MGEREGERGERERERGRERGERERERERCEGEEEWGDKIADRQKKPKLKQLLHAA